MLELTHSGTDISDTSLMINRDNNITGKYYVFTLQQQS